MSDFERLKDKIGKLRARERAPGDARTLKGATPEARVAALLNEIDETMLPRKLTFRWGNDGVLSIGVLNRRLQGVLSPSPPAFDGFIGKPLTDPDEPIAGELKSALLAAMADAGPLGVQSARLGDDDLGSDVGVSASRLARAWGLALATARLSATEALSAFPNGLGDETVAWLLIDGEEVSDQRGGAEALERLGEAAAYILDAYLNGRDALFRQSQGARAVVVATGDRGVFFIDAGERSAFLLVEAGSIGSVMSAWRAASA